MTKKKMIIWHNKGCSTSRKVLDWLEDKADVAIVDYINNPPSIETLKVTLQKMGNQNPNYILRKKDKIFLELFADKQLSDEDWIKAMHQYPSIIERPIVIIGNKAFLARPFKEVIGKLEEAI